MNQLPPERLAKISKIAENCQKSYAVLAYKEGLEKHGACMQNFFLQDWMTWMYNNVPGKNFIFARDKNLKELKSIAKFMTPTPTPTPTDDPAKISFSPGTKMSQIGHNWAEKKAKTNL